MGHTLWNKISKEPEATGEYMIAYVQGCILGIEDALNDLRARFAAGVGHLTEDDLQRSLSEAQATFKALTEG